MAFANNNGAKIYWEETGSGPTLLLIMGLGGTHKEWRRLLPALSQKYRVITFDNRGTGETVAPDETFSIKQMASDAEAVLNAADAGKAHVLGMSMGGMIAQEFALNYPGKLRSLILCVTTCGGSNAVLAKPEVLFTLQGRGISSPEDAFWAIAPYIYDQGTPHSLIEEDLRAREGEFTKPENFMRQLQAIISWPGTFPRLSKINVPTLVLHGENDQLIPCENGRALAGTIPNAVYDELENSSHIFTTDQTERSAWIILDFLRAQDQ
ncbi:MAG: alpha/beta hydrolase [Pyrinomonadaceae bacterium]